MLAIERHKTALTRYELSKPVQRRAIALEAPWKRQSQGKKPARHFTPADNFYYPVP